MPEEILTPAECEAIERLDQARTQGEWEWYGYQTGNDIRLQSKAKWRPIVMDFVRWGMQGAAPRFRDAARDVMERFRPVLNNPDNPKSQIRAIDHPDAAFIAACSTAVPRLLATIRAYRDALPPVEAMRMMANDAENNHRLCDALELRAWADRIEALEKEGDR